MLLPAVKKMAGVEVVVYLPRGAEKMKLTLTLYSTSIRPADNEHATDAVATSCLPKLDRFSSPQVHWERCTP